MEIELTYPLWVEAPITQRFAENTRLYAPFGQKGHNGIDLGAIEGTAVLAMQDGIVRFAGWGSEEKLMGSAAGQCVLLATEGALEGLEGYMTGVAHLSRIYAVTGQSVKAGDVIGLVGMTGATSGPHLHAELMPTPLQLGNGYLGRIDPSPYFIGTPLSKDTQGVAHV